MHAWRTCTALGERVRGEAVAWEHTDSRSLNDPIRPHVFIMLKSGNVLMSCHNRNIALAPRSTLAFGPCKENQSPDSPDRP